MLITLYLQRCTNLAHRAPVLQAIAGRGAVFLSTPLLLLRTAPMRCRRLKALEAAALTALLFFWLCVFWLRLHRVRVVPSVVGMRHLCVWPHQRGSCVEGWLLAWLVAVGRGCKPLAH